MNKISSLDEFAKSDLQNLSKMHGCRNRVVKFPLLRFARVDVLWLHDNQLEDISGLEVCELPKLFLLKINDNRIRGRLPVLRMLELSKVELENNMLS